MNKKLFNIILTISVVVCLSLPAFAGVTQEEADRLGKDLTPFGAERAGNADGTIPAWEGGVTQAPPNVANYNPAMAAEGKLYPDPFADEKPLYIITAKNVQKYADKLSVGVKALVEKYPDTFQIYVYPTHRTAAAPQWVYDNTKKNAVNASIVNDEKHIGLAGAFGGIPFPIPKTGLEVLTNHQMRWNGGDLTQLIISGIMHPNGMFEIGGSSEMTFSRPYYHKNGEAEFAGEMELAYAVFMQYTVPSRRKGELIIAREPVTYTKGFGKAAWQYMPGQRRVRRAPSIDFDNPQTSFGGLATYDDSYIFTGSPERFDWKVVGKKEIIIPYNTNGYDLATRAEVWLPNHHNPKYLRWELHRVWIVEGTLNEKFRHCYGKRVLYQDEDTWIAFLGEKYDTRGNLWRVDIGTNALHWDVPVLDYRSTIYYDLQVNDYCISSSMNEEGWIKRSPTDINMMTPQYARKVGIR